MNTLVRRPASASRLLDASFGSDFLGMGSLFDRLFPYNEAPARLMNSYREEDGSRVLEFNLAGFKEEEISVKLDTALHELVLRAERTGSGREERFATSIGVSPYTSPEDISVSYEAGMLSISVAPLEKRRQEALIDLPLRRAQQALEADKSEENSTEDSSKESAKGT